MEIGGDHEIKLHNFSLFLSLMEGVLYIVAVNTELVSTEPLLQEKRKKKEKKKKGLSP